MSIPTLWQVTSKRLNLTRMCCTATALTPSGKDEGSENEATTYIHRYLRERESVEKHARVRDASKGEREGVDSVASLNISVLTSLLAGYFWTDAPHINSYDKSGSHSSPAHTAEDTAHSTAVVPITVLCFNCEYFCAAQFCNSHLILAPSLHTIILNTVQFLVLLSLLHFVLFVTGALKVRRLVWLGALSYIYIN